MEKRYWEEQIAIYKEVCDAAAKIALAKEIEEVEVERIRFKQLYLGIMCLVEPKNVVSAMIKYREQLEKCENNKVHHPSSLENFVLKIAEACRDSLKETWKPVEIGPIKIDDLNKKTENPKKSD